MTRISPLLLLILAGCDPPCSSDVREIARDLGTNRYAVTEVRSCGATTGFATVVREGRASESQDDAEEVFVADSDHDAAMSGARGAIWTNVVWTRPGYLFVAYASRARVFKQRSSVKGANISFKATDPYDNPPVPQF